MGRFVTPHPRAWPCKIPGRSGWLRCELGTGAQAGVACGGAAGGGAAVGDGLAGAGETTAGMKRAVSGACGWMVSSSTPVAVL